MIKKTKTILFLFFFIFLAGSLLRGRVFASGEDVSLEVKPEIPGALEDVRVIALSYNLDVDSAKIVWSLNGKKTLEGVGEKIFSFKNGPAGKKTVVSFSAVADNGLSIQKEISFVPQDVDILWEAETYTPPFYRGKALPGSDAYLTLAAIPHFFVGGNRVSPANLVYVWKIDNQTVADASGFGRSSLRVKGPELFSEMKVELTVSTLDGLSKVVKQTIIQPVFPDVVFYPEDPLEGPNYLKALGGEASLEGAGEVGVRAEPFFFSLADIGSLTYGWQINGAYSNENEKSQTLVFRAKDPSAKGQANISLQIQNEKNIGQIGKKNVVINF